jgi:integrase/recombinase XerC
MDNIEAFLRYLSSEKKYAGHTLLNYASDLRKFSAFVALHSGSENLEKVSYGEIRQWIVSLKSAGLTNRSINRKMSALNAFYKFLLKVGQIESSPMSHHKALKIPRKINSPFTVSEMKSVLEETPFQDNFEGARDKAIIALMYATGIRKNELIQLTDNDVDLSNKFIRVSGKGNKERRVPLIPNVISLLEQYLAYRNRLEQKRASHFFLTKKGLKMYPMLVYRIVNDYLSGVTLKAKKSPHVLRHTFATHLLDEGADLNAIKELLGHASLSSTQVYTHSSMSQLQQVYKNAHPRGKK